MSDILFAGNDFSAVVPINSAARFDTTSLVRDVNYADGEIVLDKGGLGFCPLRQSIGLGQTGWFHARFHWSTFSDISGIQEGDNILYMQDSTNPSAVVFGLEVNFAQMGIFGGTDVSGGREIKSNLFPISSGTTYVLDVQFTLDPVLGSVLLYLNGVVVATWYGDTTISGQITSLDNLVLKGEGTNGNYDPDVFYSEVIVSRVSTIGQRVKSLRPVADATPADWTGTFDNVDDLTVNEGTSISSDTPEAVHLFTMGDMGAAIPSDVVIAGVVASARGSNNGTGAVTGIAHRVSSGATAEDGDTQVIGINSTVNQHVFEVDPDTGLAWTKAGVDAMLLGVKAKA